MGLTYRVAHNSAEKYLFVSFFNEKNTGKSVALEVINIEQTIMEASEFLRQPGSMSILTRQWLSGAAGGDATPGRDSFSPQPVLPQIECI